MRIIKKVKKGFRYVSPAKALYNKKLTELQFIIIMKALLIIATRVSLEKPTGKLLKTK